MNEVAAAALVAGLDATDAGGTPADDREYRFEPQLTCELLADTLAALHRLGPTDDGGPVLRPSEVLEQARRRLADGSLDEATIDPAYRHLPPARLVEVLADGLSRIESTASLDVVATHGAPTLAALRCERGRAIGFTSWEHAAYADRHRDLAVAATSVASSLGAVLVPVFVARYGATVDPIRLDWWALAAQLLGTVPAPAAT